MGIKSIIKKGRESAARTYIKLFRRDLSSKGEKVSSNSFFKECIEKYDRELEDWKDPYGYFLRNDEWERRASKMQAGESCEEPAKGRSEKKGGNFDETPISFGGHEYALLISEKAVPSAGWKEAVREALEKKSCTAPFIIYGDEDELSGGKRLKPFFKPDFSPELLEQFNYLGEMVLVRKDLLEKVCPNFSYADAPSSGDIADIVRGLTLGYNRPDAATAGGESDLGKDSCTGPAFDSGLLHAHLYKNVLHIPHILSHRVLGSAEEDVAACIGTHVECSVACSERQADVQTADILENQDLESFPTVSVIIPTKDHPEVLKTCVSSLRERSEYPMDRLEIIVVDNGSEEAKKAEYEKMASLYGYKYIYDPKPFNFSYMNNVGAKAASGELLLLLNDDTEIIEGKWLSKMAAYAVRDEVGAVGAKLLYANTNKIQHVGVTNLAVGPSHKLLALEDSENYYFGRNTLDYNMLCVTAACLLVSKKKFDEVGGLSEDLKVAYNDIDFCFKLFEHGYRSVQCNGAVLYHYESLTRGMDEGNEEKYHRLLAEKEKLYSAHPWAKGFDPFYNPNLIDNSSDYLPATKDCTTNTGSFSKLLAKDEPVLKDNFMVRARLDRVQLQLRNTEDAEDFIWIDGWAYVRGCDNRRFEKSLVLENTKTRRYELFSTYRKDILAAFPGEDHIELSGFYFRLPVKELEGKSWRAGIVMTDIVTGKRLYKDLKREIKA
ncbi:MAG: glycosyltransferase family 2 protein [Lachnospiraceae bacterium]|nr:glycosyltransferase family 2 protein [Lachnospiraceae bacterium]